MVVYCLRCLVGCCGFSCLLDLFVCSGWVWWLLLCCFDLVLYGLDGCCIFAFGLLLGVLLAVDLVFFDGLGASLVWGLCLSVRGACCLVVVWFYDYLVVVWCLFGGLVCVGSFIVI